MKNRHCFIRYENHTEYKYLLVSIRLDSFETEIVSIKRGVGKKFGFSSILFNMYERIFNMHLKKRKKIEKLTDDIPRGLSRLFNKVKTTGIRKEPLYTYKT